MKSRIKNIFVALALLASTAMLTGCFNRAPSNLKVLKTNDCGVSWEVIPTGTRIPNTYGCEYFTSLPDYPMPGDAEFQAQFEGNVLVKVRIGYDYEIVDGLKFLKDARFLGKSGTIDTASSSAQSTQFETAENMVIDIRLRDIVTEATIKSDIVGFNPSKFEDFLFVEANKKLEPRGVKLNSLTFVTIPDEQTRMAIDAMTALNVYKAKGQIELGNRLVVAKASAPNITINLDKKDK